VTQILRASAGAVCVVRGGRAGGMVRADGEAPDDPSAPLISIRAGALPWERSAGLRFGGMAVSRATEARR
jgi:hypothetical protein